MKIILALALGVISAVANAKPVTYEFDGVFDAPGRYGRYPTYDEPLFLGLLKKGDKFSGRFTYDDDSAPISSSAGFKSAIFSGTNFTIELPAPLAASAGTWTSIVSLNQGSDFFGTPDPDRIEADASAADPAHLHNLYAIINAALPNGTLVDLRPPANYNQFSDASFQLTMYHAEAAYHDFVFANAQLRLATVSPVPEPSSIVMTVASLACLGGFAALRRRRG